MADHLTPLDAAFLEIEEGDECSHMHVGWAMVFEPLPKGGTPSVEEVRDLLDDRLSLLPRFRRRLSSPRIGRFSWPTWVSDDNFDIATHVRHATVPSPGGQAELLVWLGDFYSHRLDRAHPLWEMTLVDGFADGSWVIAAKMHHSLVDGVSGSFVTSVILDAEPEPEPGSKGLFEGFPPPHDNESAVRWPISAFTQGAGAVFDVALHPRKLGGMLSRSRALAELVVRDELIGAPGTSINVEIGGTRRMAAVSVPLADLKAVKQALGGTVNDVALAVAASGLRHLFESRGEGLPERGVRAMVPVSMRATSETLALGNRVSSLFVELPVAEPDLLERYRKTVAAAKALKGGSQTAGTEALLELAGAAPPVLHAAVARLSFTPRLFNLTITNVPGPGVTLYALGAPVRRVIPLVPIFAGHAVGMAVVSYDGEVVFGVNADRGTVPDLEVLEQGIQQALDELRELANTAGAPA